MDLISNYKNSYTLWDRFCRAVNPARRNREDFETIRRSLKQFDQLQMQLSMQSADAGISFELTSEVKKAEVLLKRLSSQWFVSKKVREAANNLEIFSTSYKIATAQEIPFKIVVRDKALRTLIISNHLHHKITKQHRALGLGIQIKNGKAYIPCPSSEGKLQWVSVKKAQQIFGSDPKTGKIAKSEFLADGLEVHDAKGWNTLRPLYGLQTQNGKYVHIDTLTGRQEEIGPVGKNYIQLVTVRPWGLNPKGGALFGHTWIRFVLDGKLFHVGANLQGEIVNPDFMATVPMGTKKYTTSEWNSIDDSKKDAYGHVKSERIIIKLEALQYFLNHKVLPEGCPYGDEIIELYHQMRTIHGGTCTTAAAMMYREITGIDYVETGRPIAARVVFNPITRFVLDTIWYCAPRPVAEHIVAPMKAVSRGARPDVLAGKLSPKAK